MTLGVVGHEAAKFTPRTEALARAAIAERIVASGADYVVSGACHLGGVDVWAVEEARRLGVATREFAPTVRQWRPKAGVGFEARNLQIAEASDAVLVVVVAELPPGYRGMRFRLCYHCDTTDHVKSGGCWTGRRAREMGKAVEWVVVR